VVLLLALGCSRGTISDPWGSSPLETAIFLEHRGDQRDEAWVLLSNGYISSPCASIDPAVAAEDYQAWSEELGVALGREGARLVLAHLYRFRRETWEGVFPLSSEPVNAVLDDRTPFAAEAGYFAVLEAEADQTGLRMSYEPVETQLEVAIDSGHVEIVRASDDELRGSFALETVDVGGRFKAERCYADPDSTILPYVLGLLDGGDGLEANPSDTGD
jgi:hypothetical protein